VPEFIKLNDESVSLEVQSAAADRVLILHSRIWPAVISLIIILGIHSTIIFHRVAGPLYRFRLAFEQIKKGNLKFRVKLRKKDYLHDEEEAFNNMIETMAGKLKDIKIDSLDSLNSLYELEKQSNGWKETDKEKLRIHRGHLVKLADAINFLMP
jgi:nitrogen fixation/metabolism regulation signal transduction histidine kinase